MGLFENCLLACDIDGTLLIGHVAKLLQLSDAQRGQLGGGQQTTVSGKALGNGLGGSKVQVSVSRTDVTHNIPSNLS